MTNTTNLNLPYILPAQAQKHVTHNEALQALDAMVHLSVVDNSLNSPPQNLNEGARYIIAASPADDWAGREGQIAAWQNGAWSFFSPQKGWLCWIENQNELQVFDGAGWMINSSSDSNMLGINTSSDAINRLSISSTASLFNHEGAGHQFKINKAEATDTASILFQTGFSGRAEIATAGDDDLHVKVTSDGANWKEAMVIDANTGGVGFPSMQGAWINIVPQLPIENDRAPNTLYLVERESGVDAFATDSIGNIFPFNSSNLEISATNYSLTALWSATSQYNQGSPAGLGDGVLSGTGYWANNNILPSSITADLSSPVAISKYQLARSSSNPGWNNPNYSPASWNVEGSNDNTNWEIIDTVTSNPAILNDENFVSFTMNNSTAYQYYRFTITAAQAGNWVHISELELYA